MRQEIQDMIHATINLEKTQGLKEGDPTKSLAIDHYHRAERKLDDAIKTITAS